MSKYINQYNNYAAYASDSENFLFPHSAYLNEEGVGMYDRDLSRFSKIYGTVVAGTQSLNLNIDGEPVAATISGTDYNWNKNTDVESLSNMVKSNTDIESLNIFLPDCDITSMYAMSYSATNIEHATVTVGGGASEMNLEWAFSKCPKLQDVTFDMGGFSGTCSMKNMFMFNVSGQQASLSGITFSNFYPHVTNLEWAFHTQGKLDINNLSQNIKDWDVSACSTMNNTFYGVGNNNRYYTGEMILDLSRWNTSNVSNMSGMFRYICCDIINLSNWDMSGVIDANNSNQMFSDMVFVQKIILNNTSDATFAKIKNRMVANSATTSYPKSGSTRTNIQLIRDGYAWTYSNGTWSSTPE